MFVLFLSSFLNAGTGFMFIFKHLPLLFYGMYYNVKFVL